MLIQPYTAQLILRAGNWGPDEQGRADERRQKIPGNALSRWNGAARGGVAPSARVSEGTAKMQPQRDLQELAGGDPSQRVDTKLLELLWSHTPGLGRLNRWARGLRRAGGKKSAGIII